MNDNQPRKNDSRYCISCGNRFTYRDTVLVVLGHAIHDHCFARLLPFHRAYKTAINFAIGGGYFFGFISGIFLVIWWGKW